VCVVAALVELAYPFAIALLFCLTKEFVSYGTLVPTTLNKGTIVVLPINYILSVGTLPTFI